MSTTHSSHSSDAAFSVEMRSKVTNPLYKFRKGVDALLNTLFRPPAVPSRDVLRREAFPTPANSGWMSLYELVTFRPDISYADAEDVTIWRDKRLSAVGVLMALSATTLASYKMYKVYKCMQN